ncbi:hypothetical protein K0M31_014999 [Melipona bicolor]|uniref:RRM domain-containing protein n=1 Tax=Melipona bicolor TaxID=60889 RepID=A0AA40FGW4_9HYME|nr:hypothetical protein K0M31_014999 [Melipona bicolor]
MFSLFELEEHFSKYGTVIGLFDNRGFGFVQFEEEQSAQKAIQNEDAQCLKAEDVRPAKEDNQSSGGGGGGTKQLGGPNKGNNNFNPNNQNRNANDQFNQNRGGDNQVGPGVNQNRPLVGIRIVVQIIRIKIVVVELGMNSSGNGRPRAVIRVRQTKYSKVTTEKNDCEIIVVNKALTEYAESIEMRLKKIGLTVDLLFPNEDVLLSRVLGNIAESWMFICKHRNMLVEDAINLISRDFANYKAGGRSVPLNTPFAKRENGIADAIQVLLNMLAVIIIS